MSVSFDRLTLAKGLRDFADFIVANPEIPIMENPLGTVPVHYFPQHGTDEEMRAVIDRIAGYLGSSIEAEQLEFGHYGTSIALDRSPTAR
ncbi:hypothetical protein [Nonomuraea sp. NPDC049784]|uniref:hypothetical protein n=1 Tax=Nonomuraea sp. NPDC049784 TaxID=3154361 RepID=UPI0033FF6F8A